MNATGTLYEYQRRDGSVYRNGDKNPSGSLTFISFSRDQASCATKALCVCNKCKKHARYVVSNALNNKNGCQACHLSKRSTEMNDAKRTYSIPDKGDHNPAGTMMCIEYDPADGKKYANGEKSIRYECIRCKQQGVTKASKFIKNMSGCRTCNFGLFNYNWYFRNSDGDVIRMRSSWEVATAVWLTDNNVSWQYEPTTLTTTEGKKYTPDFFLTDINEYWEVKGKPDPRQAHNRALLMEQGHKITVLNEKHLKDMGILQGTWTKSLKTASQLDMAVEDYFADGLYRKY